MRSCPRAGPEYAPRLLVHRSSPSVADIRVSLGCPSSTIRNRQSRRCTRSGGEEPSPSSGRKRIVVAGIRRHDPWGGDGHSRALEVQHGLGTTGSCECPASALPGGSCPRDSTQPCAQGPSGRLDRPAASTRQETLRSAVMPSGCATSSHSAAAPPHGPPRSSACSASCRCSRQSTRHTSCAIVACTHRWCGSLIATANTSTSRPRRSRQLSIAGPFY